MRYAIVIERAEHNYSAYVPDVDGCVAVGDTVEDVTAQIAEALAFHFEGMAEDGEAIPAATSLVATVDVALPANAIVADAIRAD